MIILYILLISFCVSLLVWTKKKKKKKVALATGAGPYLDAVRKAQLETGLENVHCVDAKGLPLEPDGLHLTTSSQVRLGQMMVDAFLAIPNSAKPLSGFSVLVMFCLFFL